MAQKLVLVLNWFGKLLICFQPEPVFHLFLLKLKPVCQTIQTTSDGGLVGLGGIQNGDNVTTHTKMCSLQSKMFFSILREYVSSI